MRLSHLISCGVLAVASVLTPGEARACHGCKPGCAPVCAAPPTKCVTEMVPYTVMQTRTRMTYQPVECTVMVREPITQVVERRRVACRPVYETSYIQQTIRVCRPVYQTQVVDQTVCVQRPVTTPRRVASICYEPYTRTVSVPTVARSSGCGLGRLCGKAHGGACGGMVVGCATVTQTCYRPVQVERTIYETRWETETQVRQVPVTTCSMVTEDRVVQVPVTRCRMVQEVVTERGTVICGWRCVPKQVMKMVPVPVTETVPVTCYRPVMRIVSACPPSAQMEADAAAPQASGQASGQQ